MLGVSRLRLRRPSRPDSGRLSTEVLAGVLTTLALVPEVISFSVIAGVDPQTSLVASVVLAVSMSFLGGRSAMVTAAAGAVALVVAPLVEDHGARYLLPAVLLAGLIQIAFGVGGLAKLMRFVPRSVMLGFVNGLGVLIFAAQVQHVVDVPAPAYALFALTIVIVLGLPRLTRVVPAPLVAIVVVTAIAYVMTRHVPDVGDEGAIGGGLPGLTPFDVPFDLHTLGIVWPTAVSVALVGLLESLLTAKVVDDLTDTRSNKTRESWALGVANILAGFYGGIAGCAMIGQSIVNVKLGRARTRLSTLVAGASLLLFITVLSGVVARIPMVALAAVMMVVAVSTVNWQSLRPSSLRRMPRSETVVMVVTIATVVATGNLAYGVGVGVLVAMVLFARRVSGVLRVERVLEDDATVVRYRVVGPLFFASSHDLAEHFTHRDDPPTVVIDLTASHIWDASTVAVLDAIQARYTALGSEVSVVGLDHRSSGFRSRLTGRLH